MKLGTFPWWWIVKALWTFAGKSLSRPMSSVMLNSCSTKVEGNCASICENGWENSSASGWGASTNLRTTAGEQQIHRILKTEGDWANSFPIPTPVPAGPIYPVPQILSFFYAGSFLQTLNPPQYNKILRKNIPQLKTKSCYRKTHQPFHSACAV